MHIQVAGTWGDLTSSVQKHNTVILKVDDKGMTQSITKNIKDRLRKDLVSHLVVVRAPEYDKEIGYTKRYGYLITLTMNNQQAKSLLAREGS